MSPKKRSRPPENRAVEAPENAIQNGPPPAGSAAVHRTGSVRRAVLRGLGVVLPPLLTIVVLAWAWNAIENYVLTPVESGIRHVIVWSIEKTSIGRTYAKVPEEAAPLTAGGRLMDGFVVNGVEYVPDPTGRRFFPATVKRTVDENADVFGAYSPAPANASAYLHRYAQLEYLPRRYFVPIFLIVFVTALYFLGRVFTHGIGRWFLMTFDMAILSIPIVNKVYGSVKQITDFAFEERDIEFNRVVAVQYPRQGIWSLGFVTGNGMREISEAAGEPMLSVLMPTSPMPMTGFTVMVRRSEAIDLDLTVDEAIQFIVSCGVVVPPQQRVDVIAAAARNGGSLVTDLKR